jgi:hypothetical protein
VPYPQVWPQTSLQDEFACINVTFQELTFHQFVAGELETALSADCGSRERVGRLNLLKELCYIVGSNDFGNVKAVYASIVHLIERGRLQWKDDMYPQINKMLNRLSFKAKNFSNKVSGSAYNGKSKGRFASNVSGNNLEKNLFWCRDFQKGLCKLTDGHSMEYNKKLVTANHMCAKCYLRTDDKVPHRSNVCPNKVN